MEVEKENALQPFNDSIGRAMAGGCGATLGRIFTYLGRLGAPRDHFIILSPITARPSSALLFPLPLPPPVFLLHVGERLFYVHFMPARASATFLERLFTRHRIHTAVGSGVAPPVDTARGMSGVN